MAGYIGKSQGVTQVDGYTTSEADSEFVNDPNGALNISSSASTDSATIDSSGNLLVGKTNTGAGNVGAELNSNGILRIARSGAAPIEVNRTTSDGTIIDIRKDNTTVGSIRSYGGYTLDIGGANSSGMVFGSTNVLPTTDGSFADDTHSLGGSTYRWKNLYLSGGVYLGGTGSANKLDDYEKGTFSPTLEGTGITGSGTYVKVGKIVHFDMSFTSNTGISGHTGIITGLPFTSTASEYPSNGHIGRLYGVTLTNPAYVLRAYNYEISIMYIGGNNAVQGFTQTNSTVRIAITASIRVA